MRVERAADALRIDRCDRSRDRIIGGGTLIDGPAGAGLGPRRLRLDGNRQAASDAALRRAWPLVIVPESGLAAVAPRSSRGRLLFRPRGAILHELLAIPTEPP